MQTKNEFENKKNEMSQLFNEEQIAHLLNFQTDNQMIETILRTETKYSSPKISKKKKNQNSIEFLIKEEKILTDNIRKTYCELYNIKDLSLIKKMSPLEMMTKIDILFENLVIY